MTGHLISSFSGQVPRGLPGTERNVNISSSVQVEKEKEVGIIVLSHELLNSIIKKMQETHSLNREKTQPQVNVG